MEVKNIFRILHRDLEKWLPSLTPSTRYNKPHPILILFVAKYLSQTLLWSKAFVLVTQVKLQLCYLRGIIELLIIAH